MRKRGKPSGKPTARHKRDPIPQPHGGALVPGAGGGPQPGSGRPPDEFKKLCQSLASRKETIDAVEAILKDSKHPAYLGALKWATENGYGRPKESVELTGSNGGPLALTVTFVGAPE
jgi:hypothetical protein